MMATQNQQQQQQQQHSDDGNYNNGNGNGNGNDEEVSEYSIQKRKIYFFQFQRIHHFRMFALDEIAIS